MIQKKMNMKIRMNMDIEDDIQIMMIIIDLKI